MSNFIKNLFEDDKPLSIQKIIIVLFCITMIRAFFDLFSTPDYSKQFFAWKVVYLQFPLYYFWVFLIFGLVLHFFSKKPINQIFNFELKMFLLVPLKPIIDLIATKGEGAFTVGLLLAPEQFVSGFFKTMNPMQFYGITLGVHFVAYGMFFLMAIFIYRSTKSVIKAIAGVSISYLVLYLFAILPSLLALPLFLRGKLESVGLAYETTVKQSWIMITNQNNIDYLNLFSPKNLTLTQLSEPEAQVSFLLLLFLLVIYSFIFKLNILNEIKEKKLLKKVAFWCTLATLGIIIGQKSTGPVNFSNIVNITTTLTFFMVVVLSILVTEYNNIDEPLMAEAINNKSIIAEWKNTKLILTILFISGAAILNTNITFLIVLLYALWYLRSTNVIDFSLSNVISLIPAAVSWVVVVMIGFYLVSSDQRITAFPTSAIFIMGIASIIFSSWKKAWGYQEKEKKHAR